MMISQRIRESKRVRALKLPKNIERLYKEAKCRDCAVAVTRMDFAKILGKFTKVKIQYESSSPKTKKINEVTSPNSNARLKSNENGMVLIHRNAYKEHPVKELITSKHPVKEHMTSKHSVKEHITSKPVKELITSKHPVKELITSKKKTKGSATPTNQSNNVLKENNRLKRTPVVKDKNSNISISGCNVTKRGKNNAQFKQYGIIFTEPKAKNNKKEFKSKITLQDLLPFIDKNILPSNEWNIDYLPRNEEPKNDKVYDRIAAELEDLMYNEKPLPKPEEKPESTETKVDDFPSIMDILNDNSNDSSKPTNQNASTLESSDVEAMLLGKADSEKKELEPTPMEVDNTDMNNLIEDVAQLNAIQAVASDQDNAIKMPTIEEDIDNPHSPSILDEALQKGIEEHLPYGSLGTEKSEDQDVVNGDNDVKPLLKMENDDQKLSLPTNASHLIFRKNGIGESMKCVTCPKNLKYSIELDGKLVEFMGAPKFISSLEDLQVLLQIVNETELKSLYVCQ